MLILLGRYLEALAKGSASNVLTKLIGMQAVSATLTSEQEIRIELVQRGDVLKVLPGSRIPTDGVVVFGSSAVDESTVTGESIPVSKSVGDTVYGSTINQHGLIHVRVTKIASESTLASISRLVEQAQNSKAEIQRTADRIASYFVPAIVVVAILVFTVWISISATGSVDTKDTRPLPFSLRFALAVLVVSCPCAFGLAVPTAIMVGTSVGAKLGVLFKSGPILETCHNINTVIFDKTGTLTVGRPTVTSCEVFTENLSRREFLSIVGSAELGSEHVLGKAIATYAREERCELLNPSSYQAAPGKGLVCVVGKRSICIGTRQWLFETASVSVPDRAADRIMALEQEGNTVVCVAIDTDFAGIVALADTPRAEARFVVDRLQRMGVEVWMLSGDNSRTVNAVAARLGVGHVMGEVLPSEKASKVRQLQEQGKIVAMVGDGVNDSPALAQANVGIAIGAGTDIALEAADVVLVKNDLRDILVALHLSKKIFTRITINFAWACLYNLIAIPVAAGVLYPKWKLSLPPAVAGLSEILSSVPVVLLSLHLQWYTIPEWVYGIRN